MYSAFKSRCFQKVVLIRKILKARFLLKEKSALAIAAIVKKTIKAKVSAIVKKLVIKELIRPVLEKLLFNKDYKRKLAPFYKPLG